MKNIFKYNIVIIACLLLNIMQVQAQIQIDDSADQGTQGCKNEPVTPEFEFTYEPIDPVDPGNDPDPDPDPDPDDDDDQEEEENKKLRKVMFVHGYQGSESSWINAQVFLKIKENKIFDPLNRVYKTEEYKNLLQVASAIDDEYLSDFDDWELNDKRKNFFISHSMGGMALRFMQEFYNGEDKPYGGIITVGSGHKGVYAADTKIFRKDKYDHVLIETCSALLEPIIYNLMPGVVPTLITLGGINSEDFIKNGICKHAVLPAVEFLMNEDIDVDLTTVASNNYPGNLEVDHRLALYGVEEDEMVVLITKPDGSTEEKLVTDILFPKFFGSMWSSPSSFPTWGADASDIIGLATVSEFMSSLEKDFNEKKRDYNFYLSMKDYFKCRLVKIELNAIERSLRWFRDFNFQYQELIGGIQNINIHQGKCYCELRNVINNQYFNEIIQYNGQCSELLGQVLNNNEVTKATQMLSIQSKKFESDGFVLANSSSAMPGVSEPIRMQGSGHFQMRNDSNMGKEFDNMFRKNSYGTFFKLYE